jgi:hypothetical protein
MIEVLIKKCFGINSPQTKRAQEQRMGGIVSRQLLLVRFGHSLSKNNREKTRKLIKENYIDIDKRYLYKNNIIKRIFLTKRYSLFVITVYLYNWLKRIND